MLREIKITVADSGAVEVTFMGEHISRRELLRAQRAMGIGWRERVRQYRRENLAARVKAQTEKAEVQDAETVRLDAEKARAEREVEFEKFEAEELVAKNREAEELEAERLKAKQRVADDAKLKNSRLTAARKKIQEAQNKKSKQKRN